MIQAYNESYRIFWSDPVGICNQAGTEASQLFTKHVEMGQAIVARKPDFVEKTIPEGWTVEFNQDGSVTVLPIE